MQAQPEKIYVSMKTGTTARKRRQQSYSERTLHRLFARHLSENVTVHLVKLKPALFLGLWQLRLRPLRSSHLTAKYGAIRVPGPKRRRNFLSRSILAKDNRERRAQHLQPITRRRFLAYSPTGTTMIGVEVGASEPVAGSIDTATAFV